MERSDHWATCHHGKGMEKSHLVADVKKMWKDNNIHCDGDPWGVPLVELSWAIVPPQCVQT